MITRSFRLLTVLFVLTVNYDSVQAQSVRKLSTQNGLPQSFVSGLIQDNEGFVWIGTRNGLSLFDGINHRIFQHSNHDSTTIAANTIMYMRRDKHHNIWLEYESGQIDQLNPVTHKITHFITEKRPPNLPNPIRRGWIVDSLGRYWSIRKKSGVVRYDKKSGEVVEFTRASHGLPSDTVHAFLEDSQQQIWLLSRRGLSVFKEDSKQFQHTLLPVELDFTGVPNSETETIGMFPRPNGEFMFADRLRLFVFDPQTGKFRIEPFSHPHKYGVKWIRGGPDGNQYLESEGEVYRYNNLNQLVSVGNAQMNDPQDARSFMVDKSGLIWVGTNADGIHQIDMVTPFFVSYPQNKYFPSDALRQELGLSFSNLFQWTAQDENYYPSGYNFRSAYDAEGNLYLGLKDHIYKYNRTTKSVSPLPKVPVQSAEGDPGVGIKGIAINAQGRIMAMGYSGNLVEYDPANGSWSNVIDPTLIRKKFSSAITPVDLSADAERIWISTSGHGLLYIDLKTKELHQLTEGNSKGDLPTKELIGFKPDVKNPNLLWIGSYQGLIAFNKKTLKCEVYSLPEGLPDNTIYSIQSEASGVLWVSTNKGLARFNPESRHVRVFKTTYGLPGDEFNRFHHLALPDGRMIFGGTQGWTVFDPLAINNDEYKPRVALTNLRINNITVKPGSGNAILPVPLNAREILELQYSDNTIAIEFAGLQFNQPDDLEYRYQLKGYDDDWISAGHFPVASYTKIPPGKYTFLVNASNTNGEWSDHIKSMELIVKPPWWRTWWAYVFYFLIIAAIAWGFINFRISRGLMRQEVQLKQKEAEQLKEIDEMKMRFFSNITHEFRTPLTLIMGPAEELKNRYKEDQHQRKLADIITKSAGQLLYLINRLMDLAKLEAKAVKPEQNRANLAATIGSVVHSFENEAGNKNVRLVLHADTVQRDYIFAQDALERIVYNLVSNALKFTPSGGEIEVSVREVMQDIELTVKDSGIGIPAEKLPHIFDRFYQAGENNKNSGRTTQADVQPGTGIGLAIVKELVELQKGSIDVTSKTLSGEGETGTKFVIHVPFKEAEQEKAVAIAPLIQQPDADAGDINAEKKPEILLVEDNAELAGFIRGSLEQNYIVHHVANGQLGVEASLNLMPDLIISDVLMPVMDGYTMCSKVKGDIRTSHVPVIMLTAKVTQENKIEGLQHGADDYITKPFHPTELALRIRNLLERQRKLSDHIRNQLVEMPPALLPSVEPIVEEKPAPPPDPFLTKLYEIIEEHLDDPLFGVDQLVGMVDMSRTSLHRKIKALADMSTSELVRNYRLNRSTSFLGQGHSSTDTAYMSGFGSPSYFTKCFREVYGMTPGEYIQQEKIK